MWAGDLEFLHDGSIEMICLSRLVPFETSIELVARMVMVKLVVLRQSGVGKHDRYSIHGRVVSPA
jgi:hypothetical protein